MVVLCAMALMVAGAVPAAADPITQGRAFSYGLNAALAGEALIDQLPNCEAAIPPELEDFCEEIVLEVPLDGVVESGTLVAENQVAAAGNLEARLQQEMEDFAGAGAVPAEWGSVSYAVTEDLEVVDGLATAEAVQSESLAGCIGNQRVFGSAANVANLALAETEILAPILDALQIDLSPALNLTQAPNTQVVDLSPLIRITFWETNWDGATGTTDGSDTVFTNALRIRVLEGLGEGDLDDLLGIDLLDDLLGGLLGTDPTDPDLEDPDLEDPDLEDPDVEDPLGDLDLPLGQQVQFEQNGSALDVIVSHTEATVDCQAREIALGKTASSDIVAPGDTFTYNINVPNEQTCTLTDVRVVDTITGPAGFEIVSTTPTADSVDTGATSATVIWEDIGPIAPGENVQLTIGVRVPANAPDGAQFAEQLRVTGDCDGVPIDGALDFTGPTVRAVVGPLPRTGSAALLGGLAFMVFAAGLHRLRG